MFRLKIFTLCVGLGLALTGCYKAQHFTVPGPYQDADDIKDPDTVPYIFSGENRIFLIKDGVPDYSKLSLLGFTDFVPEKSMEESSWTDHTDIYGRKCLRCRQHRNFYPSDDKDHFGENKYSHQFNELISRVFLENADNKKWRVYAKMSLSSLGHDTRAMWSVEADQGWAKRLGIGMDWYTNLLSYRAEDLLTGWYNPQAEYAKDRYNQNHSACYNFMTPGESFEMELERVDKMFYLSINGKLLWLKAVTTNTPHAFPLVFRPWMNEVFFYDLSIEGDYQEWTPLAAQGEGGYVAIQAPALGAVGDEVLLFAEGHHENRVLMTLDDNSRRSNATDIIMRRSSDAGVTWSEWTLVKGGGQQVCYAPEVITDGERVHLFYTVDVNGKQDGEYRIEHIISENGGQSWGEPEVINVALEGYQVTTLSGHGLKTAAGGLAIPLRCHIGKRGTVAVAYYDGNTWSLGATAEGLRNESANLIETADGKLQMYMGNSGSGVHRKVVTSDDHGMTWSSAADATMPVGSGGQLSYGATLSAGGKLLHFTATGNVKTSGLSSGDFSSVNEVIESKERKELYIYNPPYDYLMKGMAFTTLGEDGSWSVAENILPVTGAYTGYSYVTGKMDAVVVGKMVVAVAEGGVMVPYEGLVSFRKSW